MPRSLAQRRAAHALNQVMQARENNNYGNYVSYVKALPAAIIMSGLGQALAMEKAGASKSGDVGAGHRLLYQHMDAWLRRGGEDGWSTPYVNAQDILDAIVAGSEEDYLKAQIEALEYLEWLKKFAMAYLEERGRE